MPKTIRRVVVHHADGLHQGVTNLCADEIEAAFAQVFAHDVGFIAPAGNILESFPAVLDRLPANESPEVTVKAAEFFLHGEKCFCVLDRGGDLQAVADDAGVGEQLLNFPQIVSGDFAHVEVVEGFAVVVAFFQNGRPTQSGLRAF